MQIYEITKLPVTEGLLDAFSPAAKAARAAASLSAQGYGPAAQTPPGKKSPIPSADWKDKLAQAKKDPAVKQYVSQLAQGWAQEAKKIQTPPVPPSQSTPTTPASTTSTPTQPVMLGGKRLDPNNPKDAQVLAAMQAQGKLEEGPARNRRAARRQQVNPGTAQMDPYQEAFVRWSDAQLASKDPVTYQAITMDAVRAKFPELKAELDQALKAVVSARDTPQSTAAIAQYLELAVAGVQARSQELKNKAPEVATQALSGAQANLSSIQQTLSQVGVNPRALSAFGNKAKSKNVVTTGNAEADALLKQAGFTL